MAIELKSQVCRDQPSEAFIEYLQKKYPTETEIDEVLTRKLRNRRKRQECYTPVTLEQLVEATKKLLQEKIGNNFELTKPRWLSGGASMIQMAFHLSWQGPEGNVPTETDMVLRMSPMEPVVETSFKRESAIIAVVQKNQLLPVPSCYWVDETGEYLPYPAIVYGFVTGVAKPSTAPKVQVTGIGLNFGPHLRDKLAPKVIKQMANLHRFNAENLVIEGFDPISAGSNASVLREINWWRRVWEEDRGEEEPLIRVAAQWLVRNAPEVDHVSIVHNDLRSGNFLFEEKNAEITAWLDWELVSLGDRHQDLGWLLAYQFGHYAEDGSTFLASGLLPTEQFLALYEKETGMPVDREKLKYYDVLNTWKAAIIVLGTGYRVAKGGKTHQDVVVSWLSGIGYLVLNNLKNALNEVLV